MAERLLRECGRLQCMKTYGAADVRGQRNQLQRNECDDDEQRNGSRRKPLSLSRGKLELRKTVDAGQVRQTFPHGRSKTVAVEVKSKRTYAPGAGGKMTEVADGQGHWRSPPPSSAPRTRPISPT